MVAMNWLQRRLQRDGLDVRAGDGARTRDSLLGRQVVAISPLGWREVALWAVLEVLPRFDACMTKVVTRFFHAF